MPIIEPKSEMDLTWLQMFGNPPWFFQEVEDRSKIIKAATSTEEELKAFYEGVERDIKAIYEQKDLSSEGHLKLAKKRYAKAVAELGRMRETGGIQHLINTHIKTRDKIEREFFTFGVKTPYTATAKDIADAQAVEAQEQSQARETRDRLLTLRAQQGDNPFEFFSKVLDLLAAGNRNVLRAILTDPGVDPVLTENDLDTIKTLIHGLDSGDIEEIKTVADLAKLVYLSKADPETYRLFLDVSRSVWWLETIADQIMKELLGRITVAEAQGEGGDASPAVYEPEEEKEKTPLFEPLPDGSNATVKEGDAALNLEA